MEGLAVGDEEAVRALYHCFGAPVFGLARRLLRDHHLAEEATQQTFVNAFRAASRFDARRGSLRAWL